MFTCRFLPLITLAYPLAAFYPPPLQVTGQCCVGAEGGVNWCAADPLPAHHAHTSRDLDDGHLTILRQ
jgi:hypothetical protein